MNPHKGDPSMFWTMKKLMFRTFSYGMKGVVKCSFIPSPKLYSGPGSIRKIPEAIQKKRVRKVLIVTDTGLTQAGIPDRLIRILSESGIDYVLYDSVAPNPTIQAVEDGVRLYHATGCNGLVLLGGGSPIDCGKVIAARIRRPEKSVASLKGWMKILRTLPPMFAIPTTAGSGSEVSVAAVISSPETREKFCIVDLSIIPDFAFIDPELMLSLPKEMTATTGMDALTHAIEAYIGLHSVASVRRYAEKAVALIFQNLESVYQNGNNVEGRNRMALASFYAGCAFTRASIGYVHAIAHTLGGLYGTPHGLANAVILPHVLWYSRKKARKKLARLAIESGVGHFGESEAQLAERFIHAVKRLNQRLGIPETIDALKPEDIPMVAERALKEANPMYPVPALMNRKQCENLISRLLPDNRPEYQATDWVTDRPVAVVGAVGESGSAEAGLNQS